MKIDDINVIGVAGAGQMGSGIAQVAAASGWAVRLYDVEAEALERARRRIQESLTKSVDKGTLPADQVDAILTRLRTITALEDLADAQLVIEAAPEDPKLKAGVFRRLAQLCSPETILASNTSSISITRLGSAATHPERVVGIHFMNPVPVMRLIEVVKGEETADATVACAFDLARRMGKTPVLSKDTPGFIVNRILMPMINEAAFALETGVASTEDIDLAMRIGANHPMGPLALADRIGLDTVLAICEVLQEDLDDPKFRPSPLLRKYVDAGWLGRKTGRGFFNYRDP
ncbi:MAG: 3-hydroxyacyl-CoA dehydrogenase family protein [Nitrospirales bacterium]